MSDAPPALRPGRLGVLGWPVSHSRSPQMHRAAFAELGLRGWSYQRLPVPPELFAELVAALAGAGFVGANVTLPHKPAALALADTATRAAREIGAANTLSFLLDGSIEAENTDAPALLAAIGEPLAGEARWCWAPAAPRGRRFGRSARRAARSRSGTAARSGRAPSPASWRLSRSSVQGPRRYSSTPPRSAWTSGTRSTKC